MGTNATLVVYGNAMDFIKNDPNFGRNVAQAIDILPHMGGRHVDVPAGNHSNAAMVVESHHADSTTVITVAGNLGIKQLEVHGWNHNTPEGRDRVLRAWATECGYELAKAGTTARCKRIQQERDALGEAIADLGRKAGLVKDGEELSHARLLTLYVQLGQVLGQQQDKGTSAAG